jgi:hypothetical protein
MLIMPIGMLYSSYLGHQNYTVHILYCMEIRVRRLQQLLKIYAVKKMLSRRLPFLDALYSTSKFEHSEK